MIRYKCVEYCIEALKMAADVFNLAMHGRNTPGNQRNLFAGADRLHGTIPSSEAQIQ